MYFSESELRTYVLNQKTAPQNYPLNLANNLKNIMKSFLFYNMILAIFSIVMAPTVAMENDATPASIACKVKQHSGVPTLFVNGEPRFPMAFMSYYPTAARYEAMGKHDVHFYSVSLTLTNKWLGGGQDVKWNTSGLWRGPDDVDFAVLDKSFKEIVANDPKALIVARVFCDSPEWWDKLHPNDCYGPATGPLRRQSFSSIAWRNDVSKVLEKIVKYVAVQEYGNHVIGYMPCAGGTEELAVMPQPNVPCEQVQFRKWIWEKYGKDEKAIQRLFAKPIQQVVVPPHDVLYKKTFGDLLDPEKSQLVIDYREFHSNEVVDSALAFCSAVKRASNNRLLAGVFYGYTRILPDAGHLSLQRLLASNDVDFVTTPCGGGGGKNQHLIVGNHAFPHYTQPASVLQSGKLFYSEIDVRTSLCKWISQTRPDIDPNGAYDQARWFGPPTVADSLQLLKAVYARVLVSGWTNWWFDLWGGWYDDEAVMDLFAEMQKIGDQSLSLSRKSNAQVAIFLDENAYRYIPYGVSHRGNRFAWISQQIEEIGKMGAPYELHLLSDLNELDMSQFRMVFFLNATVLSDKQRETIRRRCMSDDRLLVWMYAPGLIKEKLDVENVSSLLGMRMAMDPSRARSEITVKLPTLTNKYAGAAVSPFLHVAEGADASVGRTADNHVVVAEKREKDFCNLFVSMPPAPWKILQFYAEKSGVHIYSKTGELVFANENYLAVSAATSGKRTICLPKRAALKELLAIGKGETTIGKGQSFVENTTFEIDFADHTCRIFQIVPPQK